MTPVQLFIHRVTENIKFQFRSIKLVVDWIIALYIVIPGIVIGGFLYAELWTKTPDWFQFVPIALVPVIVFLAMSAGSFRYFIEGGDQLFLLFNKRWLQTLIRCGFIYTLIKKLIMASIVAVLLLPLLILQFKLPGTMITCLFLFSAIYTFILSILKLRIAFYLKGWKLFVAKLLFNALNLVIFVLVWQWTAEDGLVALVIAVGLLFSLPLWLRWRLGWKGTYFFDIEQEGQSRLGLLSLVAMEDESFKMPSRRKRPLLFRKSQAIFPGHSPASGLAESIVKVFARTRVQIQTYLMLLFISASTIWTAPIAAKWILWLLVSLVLSTWMRTFSRNVLKGPMKGIFKLEDAMIIKASSQSVFWLALPAFVLISLLLGYVTYGWLGVAIMLVIAPLLMKAVSSIITSF